MPVISIKELAELTNKKPKDIHVYIGRGNIVKRKDNLIDTTNETNKFFIEKHSKIENNQSQVNETVRKEIKPPKKTSNLKDNIIIEEQENIEDENINISNTKYVSANDLNRLRANKLIEETKQLSLKNKRLENELIELETFTQIAFEVINAYRQTLYLHAENVLVTNMKMLDGTNGQIVEAKSNLSSLFNLGSADAIESLKNSITKIL